MKKSDDLIQQFCSGFNIDCFDRPDDALAPIFETFWLAINAAVGTALAHRGDGGSKWYLRESEGSPTWLVQTLAGLTRDIAEAAKQESSGAPGDPAERVLDFANCLKSDPSILLASERETLAKLRCKAESFLSPVLNQLQDQPE